MNSANEHLIERLGTQIDLLKQEVSHILIRLSNLNQQRNALIAIVGELEAQELQNLEPDRKRRKQLQ